MSGELPTSTDPGEGKVDTSRKDQARWIALGILAVYLVLLVVLNTEHVNVHLVFYSAGMPLLFALALAAIVGFVAGWLLRARRERPKPPPQG
jgi:uncharacterized integral membrane protein